MRYKSNSDYFCCWTNARDWWKRIYIFQQTDALRWIFLMAVLAARCIFIAWIIHVVVVVVVVYVMTMQNWLFSAASIILPLSNFSTKLSIFSIESFFQAQNKWTKLFHFTMIFIVLLMSLRLSFVLLYRFFRENLL